MDIDIAHHHIQAEDLIGYGDTMIRDFCDKYQLFLHTLICGEYVILPLLYETFRLHLHFPHNLALASTATDHADANHGELKLVV